MEKYKELSNQIRQTVVDLHESGNGYIQMHKQLNIPLTTVTAAIQKFEFANLPDSMTSPRRIRKTLVGGPKDYI